MMNKKTIISMIIYGLSLSLHASSNQEFKTEAERVAREAFGTTDIFIKVCKDSDSRGPTLVRNRNSLDTLYQVVIKALCENSSLMGTENPRDYAPYARPCPEESTASYYYT